MSSFLPHWNDTITVLNKLSGRDSITKIDTWKKTIVHACFYKNVIQRSISGTSAAVSQSAVCRIPKNSEYLPYHQWKDDISSGFTLSVGDYIIKGEVTEDVTAENVVSVYNSHKPDAMLVKAVSDNSDFLGLAEHYRVEGV